MLHVTEGLENTQSTVPIMFPQYQEKLLNIHIEQNIQKKKKILTIH